MSGARVQVENVVADVVETVTRSAGPEPVLLATALARSFELLAGIALLVLTATAVIVLLIPSSAASRAGFAVELVGLGLALVGLALLLSRRSAHAVLEPLEVLDAALVAIARGDLSVQVRLDQAAAEIQFVGSSVNTMVRELRRLRTVELERTKDERVRRELSEVVHSSLDVDHVVARAVEVVGAALDVDRIHIRLLEPGGGRLAAEWRRGDDVDSLRPISPTDELGPLVSLIGVTGDRNAMVIDDAFDVGRFSVEQRIAFEELGVRAALKYPLVVGSRVAGVIVASEQRVARVWSDSEVVLMQGFAREIGRALDHALAYALQNEMVERLGVLDRAKNDFLAEVSRQVRGPLASVLGYIELLTEDSDDPVTRQQRHMLEVVRRNSQQLLVLIDDLLTMSRMESGTFEAKLSSVDLDRIVHHVYDEALPAVQTGELTLEVEVEPGLALIADAKQIERAIQNLVSNAVKFTPAGGRIDVTAHSEGDDIVIIVRDTGIGISVEDQDELFLRFFNAAHAPTRETLGSGLGLYIVKQIVDGHGGTIDVSSYEGHGSTFTMRLPTHVPRPHEIVSENRGTE